MENTLFDLQIRKLERRLTASQLDPTSCVDGYGKERKNGATWKVHDCKSCECKVSISIYDKLFNSPSQ